MAKVIQLIFLENAHGYFMNSFYTWYLQLIETIPCEYQLYLIEVANANFGLLLCRLL